MCIRDRFKFADVVLVVEILKTLLDGGRQWQRTRVGQAAEITAGAGNQVLQQADGRRGQPDRLGTVPDGCLLYTSDAADERSCGDLGGRRIIKKKKQTLDACQRHSRNVTNEIVEDGQESRLEHSTTWLVIYYKH